MFGSSLVNGEVHLLTEREDKAPERKTTKLSGIKENVTGIFSGGNYLVITTQDQCLLQSHILKQYRKNPFVRYILPKEDLLYAMYSGPYVSVSTSSTATYIVTAEYKCYSVPIRASDERLIPPMKQVTPPKNFSIGDVKLLKELNTKQIHTIAGGKEHAIALGKKVFCWGKNDKGQCGVANTINVEYPKVIPTLENMKVSNIFAIEDGSFFVADGQLYACGSNFSGILGVNSSKANIALPTLVPFAHNAMLITQIVNSSQATILVCGGNMYSTGKLKLDNFECTTTVFTHVCVNIVAAVQSVALSSTELYVVDENQQLHYYQRNPPNKSTNAIEVMTSLPFVSVGFGPSSHVCVLTAFYGTRLEEKIVQNKFKF